MVESTLNGALLAEIEFGRGDLVDFTRRQVFIISRQISGRVHLQLLSADIA